MRAPRSWGRHEAHAVAGHEQSRFPTRRIEEPDRASAEDVPTARRRLGIYPGITVCHGHAPRRYTGARTRAPWQAQPGVETCQVGEAGDESQKRHVIEGRGMPPHYVVFGKSKLFGHRGQVLSVISHGEVVQA